MQSSNLRIQGKVSNAAVNTLLAEKIICLKIKKKQNKTNNQRTKQENLKPPKNCTEQR